MDIVFDNHVSIGACHHQLYHIREREMCQMIGLALSHKNILISKMEELFKNIVNIGACRNPPWNIYETVICGMVGLTPLEGVSTRKRLSKFIRLSTKNKNCSITVPNTISFVIANYGKPVNHRQSKKHIETLSFPFSFPKSIFSY